MNKDRIGSVIFTVLLTGLMAAALAEDFETRVKASDENASASTACREAYLNAEDEALLQIHEFFAEDDDIYYDIRLLEENETRTVSDSGKTICVFEGLWRAELNDNVTDLLGSERAIEGEYHASCHQPMASENCWPEIVDQARRELKRELSKAYPDVREVDLHYIDFEGREQERYHPHRSDITADGIFYFRVIKASPGREVIIYQQEPTPSNDEQDETSEWFFNEDKEKHSGLDFTVSFSWDINNRADHNDLAITSNRLGLGIWADNRLGFAAFLGEDKVGIADRDSDVQHSSGDYRTFGIGVGHRLFDNRSLTIENFLYYVDAEPYNTTINPDCSTCTIKEFSSENYLQTTTNIKTNGRGPNIGWMFTWKWLERESDLDHWSSGFYLEWQI